ncbi:MAG: molecular chaperone DnaJ [Bacillota bacterium]
MSKRDYYEVLGMEKNAGADDIKKAYRRLAKKYHPDVNPGDKQAEQKFKEINEAYEVLSDDTRRKQYDTFGHTAANGQGGFGGYGDFGGFGGYGDFGGFGDIFETFFGGGFSGGRAARRPAKGNDIRADIELEFEEAAFGVTKEIKVRRQEKCTVCDGTGAKPGTSAKTCDKCGGTGQVRYRQNTALGRFETVRTCDRCHGEGTIVEQPCDGCGGTGRTLKTRTITIKVPAGVDNGSVVSLRGEGEPGERGGPSGDLYVYIRVRPHKVFRRENENVYCDIPISFAQAALGDEITVPTLDGKVKQTIPEGTQSGTVFRLRGKGIPRLNNRGRGDQYVKVVVEVPRKLSAEQKELLRKFDELGGGGTGGTGPGNKSIIDKVKDAFGV